MTLAPPVCAKACPVVNDRAAMVRIKTSGKPPILGDAPNDDFVVMLRRKAVLEFGVVHHT